MAIKIIGEDKQKIKETSCRNCASRLEYTMADTTIEKRTDYTGCTDTYNILKCPKCGNKISVGYYL